MDNQINAQEERAEIMYRLALKLLTEGGHVKNPQKEGRALMENAALLGSREAQKYLEKH